MLLLSLRYSGPSLQPSFTPAVLSSGRPSLLVRRLTRIRASRLKENPRTLARPSRRIESYPASRSCNPRLSR